MVHGSKNEENIEYVSSRVKITLFIDQNPTWWRVEWGFAKLAGTVPFDISEIER